MQKLQVVRSLYGGLSQRSQTTKLYFVWQGYSRFVWVHRKALF